MFPKGFSSYVRKLTEIGERPDQKLARFAARYKMAGQISSVELLGYRAESAEIYKLVLRISLAYSALESLEAVTGRHSVSVLDSDIAFKLKSQAFKKFREFSFSESDNALQRRLQAFYESKGNKNLRPVIEVLRNTMFHGQFSPNASGLNSATKMKLIERLELVLFTALDQKSSSTFSELLRK